MECCQKNIDEKVVVWRDKDNFSGPDETGWCIGTYSGGDVSFINVKYCPFCGMQGLVAVRI